MTRIIVAVVAGVTLFILAAIYFGAIVGPPPIGDRKGAKPTAEELGGDLYQAAAYPPILPGSAKGDPIILRAVAAIKDKQEVPSLVSGQILYIGEGIPDGVVEAVGALPFLAEPYNYNTITVGDEKHYKFYRTLRSGMVVHSDQVIGMLECSVALEALMEKQGKIEMAENEVESALAASDEAASRYERDRQLATRQPPAIAPAELSASMAAKKKFAADYKVKLSGLKIAKTELMQAQTLYAKHEIRNKVPFERCVIQYVHKQRGDPVKESDIVMTVHSLDHLQAEALVDASYLDRIGPEMTATIEPTHEVRPRSGFPGAHRGEVTAIAVTNDEKTPRIVSAGTDRVVNVRDPVTRVLPVRLPHDDVVRTLVCSPIGAPDNLCISAAGNKIYIWNVDAQALSNGPTAKPVHIIPDAHARDGGGEAPRITCLAFSPDGAYFASGGDDGSIAIHKTADGSVVYHFDAERGADHPHSDPITSLTFTPQCRLVSAAGDKTVRIWQLKEKGVILEGEPIAGRDGNVPQLGVRPDGKWFLFDKGPMLQFLSLEQPGATITTLQNAGNGSPFETLALFSPDGNLVLTAGLPEGRLQLWKAPTEITRGFEVRQYAPKDKQSPVTCAAFFPRHAYVVSGNAAGEVYFWALPSQAQIDEFRIEHVPVRLLAKSIDANTHQARIAVDVPNPKSPQYPDGRLLPGRAVTVVIGEE